MQIKHGSAILKFPRGGFLYHGQVSEAGKSGMINAPLFGIMRHGSGHVVAYGDSNCLDGSHQSGNCYNFLLRILDEAVTGKVSVKGALQNPSARLSHAFGNDKTLPIRRPGLDFKPFSIVLSRPLSCYQNSSPCQRARNCPAAQANWTDPSFELLQQDRLRQATAPGTSRKPISHLRDTVPHDHFATFITKHMILVATAAGLVCALLVVAMYRRNSNRPAVAASDAAAAQSQAGRGQPLQGLRTQATARQQTVTNMV